MHFILVITRERSNYRVFVPVRLEKLRNIVVLVYYSLNHCIIQHCIPSFLSLLGQPEN